MQNQGNSVAVTRHRAQHGEGDAIKRVDPRVISRVNCLLPSRMRRRHLAIATTAALIACDEAAPPDESRRRDSNGITIVESPAPMWGAGESWTVGDHPVLTIGEDTARTAPTFSLVRSVVRLSDGRVVVSDDDARNLSFFDRDGTLLKSVGAPGQGPGEYGYSVLRIWVSSAGLVVADGANTRVNVLDDTGGFVRTVRFAPLPDVSRIAPHGVFADGSLLASGATDTVRAPPMRESMLVQRDRAYLHYSATGHPLGRPLTLPDAPAYAYSFAGALGRTRLPFAPEPLVLTRGNALLVYRGPQAEFEELTRLGRVQRIVRWGTPVRAVADVWDRYRAAYLERDGITPFGRQSYTHFFGLDLPLPDVLPSTERILVDGEDNIWALRYRLPWQSEYQWDVLSRDGAWLGTVTTPASLTVYQVGADFVLGVHRDSLGVHSVRMHALGRGAR